MIEDQGILKQSRVEGEALRFAKESLAAIIAWPAEGKLFTRKLSGLRFQVKSFQHHVDRMFAIEEHDGYMDLVADACPQLTGKVEKLQQQHTKIRNQIKEIMPLLDRMLPDDWQALATLCEDLASILALLDEHTRKERALIQEAFGQDLGGEGGA